VNKSGYGLFGANSTFGQLAHRWAWKLTRGHIPHGMSLCHTCDNKRCVNPNHMYPGTHQQNMRDLWERHPPKRRGTANGRATLNPIYVGNIRIRSERGESITKLAEEFGVTKQCVAAIAKRKIWRHVPDSLFKIDLPTTPEHLAFRIRQLMELSS
jgi:hypothetical protein